MDEVCRMLRFEVSAENQSFTHLHQGGRKQRWIDAIIPPATNTISHTWIATYLILIESEEMLVVYKMAIYLGSLSN